jgi:ABC-type Mn2+/Zn2+ transport system ATPase subunit
MPQPSHKTNNHDIAVQNLVVSYGNKHILHDVSFLLPQGSITAILGPNGSGKTTLMRTMLGLLPYSKGSITFFGKLLHDVRDKIGYVPQKFSYSPDLPITVEEYMELARRKHTPKNAIHKAIHEVGLHHHVLSTTLSSLSGGQLQRVLIAQAILNNPEILLLDEPSSNIDMAGEATFYEIIAHLNQQHKTTIVMVSHDVASIAHIVSHVVCLNGKLLCAGPRDKVLTKKNLGELFGDTTELYDHSHPAV